MNLQEEAIKLNEGIKTINPAFNNPEVAKEIADQFTLDSLRQSNILKLTESNIKKPIMEFYGKNDLANKILSYQPFYYDNGKNWWVWNYESYCWSMIDETDIMNIIKNLSTANTINSKERSEILEALKQTSRKYKPKPLYKTWIQFKDEIFDIINGDKFKASPEYFVTNPIPYKLHTDKLEQTPVMDKIFEEWVGKDNVQTLYEIIAYSLLPDYPIHRLFCFIGSGMNGKSCFLNLLKKFIGINNVCATELDTLLQSRFEVTRLYKKLVCMMGETNFAEISKTSILKKLTGGDLIGYEYKNKTPFEDINYAKIIISTNNLPTTTDKTIGFYRRWMIIDFPNQFSEQKDILFDIPEEEYESLALKCTIILKDLIAKRSFHNEGSIEERTKRFEDKSNFFDKFFNDYIELDCDCQITKIDFEKKLLQFCKNNRHRMLSPQDIKEKMKERSIEDGRFYVNWFESDSEVKKQVRGWLGIKWK